MPPGNPSAGSTRLNSSQAGQAFTDPHNHYTYTGQEWDENMEVYEFYARAYDPQVGVWLQQDVYRGQPIDPLSLHRYMYVKDSPVNWRDEYGYGVYEDAKDTWNWFWGQGVGNITTPESYVETAEWFKDKGVQNLIEATPGAVEAVGDYAFGLIQTSTYVAQYSSLGRFLDKDEWDYVREVWEELHYEYDKNFGATDWKYSSRYTDRGLVCDAFTGICHTPDFMEACQAEKGYILTHTIIEVVSLYQLTKGVYNTSKAIKTRWSSLGNASFTSKLRTIGDDVIKALFQSGADDAAGVVDDAKKPLQDHHMLTDKHSQYTPQFEEIARKYGLDLADDWNKVKVPHQGRHTDAYHKLILEELKRYDQIAAGDQDIFLELLSELEKKIVEDPLILYEKP